MSEAGNYGKARFPVKWHCYVKSLRPGGFDPTWKTQLFQQRPQVERCSAQNVQIVARWIEIKDADVGLVEVRRTRRPHVNRDAVLVREPQQRSRVGDNRMIDRPFVLWNLDAFQPFRKTFRNVLLKEPGRAYAAVITLHCHGPTPDVRQH